MRLKQAFYSEIVFDFTMKIVTLVYIDNCFDKFYYLPVVILA